MIDIRNYSLEELEGLFKNWRAPAYYAREVFFWLYKRGARSFGEMTNLSVSFRTRLQETFLLGSISLLKKQESFDGTKKLIFSLEDTNIIESVLIPAQGRMSACLSTQVGCKYACKFCASGMSGFKRNLSPSEIVSQVLEINCLLKDRKITHIVFMGGGEPLDNYDGVLKAIRIINSKNGLNIGARRITISSAGVIPTIEKLAGERLQIELSISLHASDDRVRSSFMPINKKYPLKELINTCKKYALVTKRQVTFEYVLIKNMTCSAGQLNSLVKLLEGWDTKVNLIIYNNIKELSYEPPEKSEVLSFREGLKKAGIPVTIRKSRGQDIQAACGQLRASFIQKEPR